MNKKILLYTTAISAVGATAFAVSFGVYYNKYQSLEKTTGSRFGNKIITIDAYKKDGTLFFEKKYTTKANEKTLQDLMLDHKADFGLSAPSTMGRFLNRVGSLAVDYTKTKSWLQLTSKTYTTHYPSFAQKASKGFTPKEGALNVGVSGVYLFNDEVIKIYETAAA